MSETIGILIVIAILVTTAFLGMRKADKDEKNFDKINNRNAINEFHKKDTDGLL